MSSEFYRVSNSQAVAERFKAIVGESKRLGFRADVLRASRWIFEELERTPLEFGESREGTDEGRLQMRLAFVGPLQVLFGVHEPSRTVFVSKMALRKKR